MLFVVRQCWLGLQPCWNHFEESLLLDAGKDRCDDLQLHTDFCGSSRRGADASMCPSCPPCLELPMPMQPLATLSINPFVQALLSAYHFPSWGFVQ